MSGINATPIICPACKAGNHDDCMEFIESACDCTCGYDDDDYDDILEDDDDEDDDDLA